MHVKNNLKNHWALILLLIIATFLMFSNLGDRVLWGDEAVTANLGKNILIYGYPRAYDGRNLIIDHAETDTLLFDENYMWRWQPWLSFYLEALSFKIFGFNTFAARLPFALAGLFTILAVYFITGKLAKNKKIALLSTTLLVFYVPFYLYSRQARYYSLAMLLSCLVLYSYLKFINKERHSFLFFVLANILSFYSFYFSFFGVLGGIIVHFILFKIRTNNNIRFLKALGTIAFFTVPWFIYAGLAEKTSMSFMKIAFGLIYSSSYLFLYVFPIIFSVAIPFVILKFKNRKIDFREEYSLLILIALISVIVVSFSPWKLTPLRYLVFLFPIFIIINAIIINFIKEKSKIIALLLIIILLLTNYLFIFPFNIFQGLVLAKLDKGSEVYYFIEENLRPRYLFFDYLYEITHTYSGPNEKIVEYLKINTKPDDIILTNNGDLIYNFYLNTVSYREGLNRTPDWIIPREPYCLWENNQNCNAQLYAFVPEGNYTQITLNGTDYVYLLDDPHPRTHRFRTNTENAILDRYETYPLVIYHKNGWFE